MKRLAILIGAPGPPNNFLRGVNLDIKNYHNFLLSPSGGAWEESEIVPTINPDKEKLIKLINCIDVEYLLIVFSGHGAYLPNGQTSLSINKTQNLTLDSLYPKAQKKMVIVDSCRRFAGMGMSGLMGEQLRNFPSELTKQQARRFFDNHLSKCENGTIICYSCSIGEASSDDPNNGGYFTTSLLDQCHQWVEKPSGYNILPINSAFSLAKNKLLTKSSSTQNPKIKTYQDRKNWFPFAIRKATELLKLR